MDFGKEVIPGLLGKARLSSFIFDGYWEDIGTVASFFEANLSLASDEPPFNFFEEKNPVYTHARYLPASIINQCSIDHAIISDGCIIQNTHLTQCVIGVRSIIRSGSRLERTIMLGGTLFKTPAELKACEEKGIPPMGVGRNCHVSNAIIDKNARIGNDVTLSPPAKSEGTEGHGYVIRDGIIVVLKGALIPDGTTI